MSIETATKERSQLHNWIDHLPPHQLDIIYRLVEELMMAQPGDETEYLLSSQAMKERLLSARDSEEGISIEVVREKLGI